MEFIAHIPATVKVLMIFATVVVLMKYKIRLGLTLFMGAFVMGLWFQKPVLKTLEGMGLSCIEFRTLSLIILIAMLLTLSRSMKEAGSMTRMVRHVRKLSGSPVTAMAMLPAIIGLIPMPGGAVFSCPMVEEAAQEIDTRNSLKTVINYWCRHCWEYWWPLYPGVILAVTLVKIDIEQFIAGMIPLTMVHLTGAYLFLLRPLSQKNTHVHHSPQISHLNAFLLEITPILIIVASILVLGNTMRLFVKVSEANQENLKHLPFAIGLVIAIVYVCASAKLPVRTVTNCVFSRDTWTLVFDVAGVMAFAGMLERSAAVEQIKTEFIAWNIPLLPVVMLLPFLAGLVTGLAIGFVGASFPLVISLLPDNLAWQSMIKYIVIAYGFGYIGMMLSPVHICFILTRDYFKTPINTAYRHLLLPVVFLGCGILLLALVWHVAT